VASGHPLCRKEYNDASSMNKPRSLKCRDQMASAYSSPRADTSHTSNALKRCAFCLRITSRKPHDMSTPVSVILAQTPVAVFVPRYNYCASFAINLRRSCFSAQSNKLQEHATLVKVVRGACILFSMARTPQPEVRFIRLQCFRNSRIWMAA
jgi:hypothetical protein